MTPSFPVGLKVLHWTTLACLVALYAIAWSIDSFDAAATRKAMLVAHQSIGLTVIVLTIVRFCVRQIVSLPETSGDLPAWMQWCSRAMHAALYLTTIALPVSGWLYASAKGAPIVFFWLIKLPKLVTPDDALADRLIAVHETVGLVLLGLIGCHVAAALYHHFVRRDDVLNAMLPRFSKA